MAKARTRIENDYSSGIRMSLYVHMGFLALLTLKSIVFPEHSTPLVPTLRVDIVALPDLLKKDLMKVPKPADVDKLQETLKKAESQAKDVKAADTSKVERPDPNELVMKPKKADAQERKVKSALARIKALAKISEGEDDSNQIPLIKGNMISKGTSLSGDAKEAAQASYYDLIRDKLQENWALPIWIARQNYSAQIQIFVDGRGRLADFRFIKLSGNAQFDDAVKKTVQNSQPYPLPPSEIRQNVLVDGILVGFPL